MRVLGIETSCDETAVSLIEADGIFNQDFKFHVLGNALLSQTITHEKFGGVVPNLAKREHGNNLVPMLVQCLGEAGMLHAGTSVFNAQEMEELLVRETELHSQLSEFLQKHEKPEIDCIAVTVGPGLEPALWVGINFARALSKVWSLPVVAVNHMEGHVVMSMAEMSSLQSTVNSKNKKVIPVNGKLSTVNFPLLALLISGGHTELVLARKWKEYEVIGATRDDAVGEAFDKVARLIGLPYPGGPHISRLAEDARKKNLKASFSLPRPMLHEDNLDFSFSGLKTAVLRIVENNSPLTEEMKSMISLEFENVVADVLVEKTLRAVDAYGARTIIIGGGVSANKHIRLRLTEALAEVGSPSPLVPPPGLSTDNALMISLAGYFHALSGDYADTAKMRANGNLQLGKDA